MFSPWSLPRLNLTGTAASAHMSRRGAGMPGHCCSGRTRVGEGEAVAGTAPSPTVLLRDGLRGGSGHCRHHGISSSRFVPDVDLTLQHTNHPVLVEGPEITVRPVGTRRP